MTASLKIVPWLASLFVSVVVLGDNGPGRLGLEHLRCEHRVEPRGIDARLPHLSWRLVEGAPRTRGRHQTAYRVLVASSLEHLSREHGDLWDSGRVASSATQGVVYDGVPLRSGMQCFWMVRAWDTNAEASAWSDVARFTVGLLEPSDWDAAWIGYDAARDAAITGPALDGAQWIWHAADPPLNAPGGVRVFRGTWDLPQDAILNDAQLIITADNALSVFINGTSLDLPEDERQTWESASVVAPGALLRHGANAVAIAAENESEGPAALIAKLIVPTASGDDAVFVTDHSWRSAAKPEEAWVRTGFDDGDWPRVRELGAFGMAPWGELQGGALLLPPPRYLRGTFAVRPGLKHATLYASALGVYEAQINGERIGEDWFTPGWTDYDARVYYNTYDVTEVVQVGENAFGAILADGWYSGHIGWGRVRDHYGTQTRFRGQVVLEYDDGGREIVGTGGDWKASTKDVR